ncbi:MAG TPA: DUF2339 domain-containing protein [Candidatus Binatia bacterium]
MEILFVLIALAGGVCGILALLRLRDITQRLSSVERELRRMRISENEEQTRAVSGYAEQTKPPAERPLSGEPKPADFPSATAPLPPTETTTPSQPQFFGRAEPAARRREPEKTLREQLSSFEVTVGSKWLNWVGIVLVTIGILFFLKFAYDNQWIGPRGRIAIGAILGASALLLGERARRRDYPILFHTLTGGGLAAFYGCIFFSFQIYQLTGQTASFLLLILVTALALAMSVVHDAPLICLFGQLGGFLSPVLISTGENRPVELFTFVAILNLAAVGCAYAKNWRHVNVVAFAGTWLLYAGWAANFYDDAQLRVALFFSSLFYLMFLIVPALRAAVRREPLEAQELWLIAANTTVEFANNYSLLFSNYRPWLGLAVIVQALTLSALYAYWARRCPEDSNTRITLLFGALALVTVAIPIQLRQYGIPIAWALEAVLVGFIGVQYRQWVFQFAALVAIILAALGLLVRLPLHSELFTPILNRPFGSWATVIAMSFALYALFRRRSGSLDEVLKTAAPVPLALAVVLLCALIHMEIAAFWDVRRTIWPSGTALSHQYTSLIILWSAIPLIFLALGRQGILRYSVYAALIGYAVGLLVLLTGAVGGAWIPWSVPFLNPQWLSRFIFVVSLWIGANWMRAVPDRPGKGERSDELLAAVEGAGHTILVCLLYVEVDTWVSGSNVFSSFMRSGFVSALWSVQALALIAIGLGTRNQFRRIFGFILFGVTVAKLLLIDMAILQPVYRILSFAATGVLLIVAAYLYQRFAKALLESNPDQPRAVSGSAS